MKGISEILSENLHSSRRAGSLEFNFNAIAHMYGRYKKVFFFVSSADEDEDENMFAVEGYNSPKEYYDAHEIEEMDGSYQDGYDGNIFDLKPGEVAPHNMVDGLFCLCLK